MGGKLLENYLTESKVEKAASLQRTQSKNRRAITSHRSPLDLIWSLYGLVSLLLASVHPNKLFY